MNSVSESLEISKPHLLSIKFTFHLASHCEKINLISENLGMSHSTTFLTTLLSNATVNITTPNQILNENYGLTDNDILIIIVVSAVLLSLGIIICAVFLIKKCCEKRKPVENCDKNQNIGVINIAGVQHDTENWSEIQLDTF